MKQNCTKLLILDLDETLIHASDHELEIKADFQIDKYYIYKRPRLEWFLYEISLHYKLGLWSSASDLYVSEVATAIKPASVNFEIIWGRSKCSFKKDRTYEKYYFEKKLDKLEKHGFFLDQILIVDDRPEGLRKNYGNAIYIKEFTGNKDDIELIYLYEYLYTLRDVENVRAIEKRKWRAIKG